MRRVVEPLLSGSEGRNFTERDLEYVRDLGLVAAQRPLRVANPIYTEVIPRQLTYAAEEQLVEDPAWYVDAGGALDVDKLLGAFQGFFREHSEHWVERFEYREAGPQLLLQAFLQRIVNSGGRIEREYGLGRGRTDLLIVWPRGRGARRYVVECKVLHGSVEKTVEDGVRQTAGYMDRCAAEAGHLVIFDRGEGAWDEKVFRREERAGSRTGHRVGDVTRGLRSLYYGPGTRTDAGRRTGGANRLHRNLAAGAQPVVRGTALRPDWPLGGASPCDVEVRIDGRSRAAM